MAEEIIKRLVDDIDRSTDDVTRVEFTWEGTAYEIDLAVHNRTKITDALTPLLQNGRKVKTRRTAARSNAGEAEKRKRVRQWAADNSIEIPARGRIPASVLARYEEAASTDSQEASR